MRAVALRSCRGRCRLTRVTPESRLMPGRAAALRQAVQAERALINIRAKASDMDRHSYLTSLQARAPRGRAPTAMSPCHVQTRAEPSRARLALHCG